jgi:hypothetical protein
MAVDEAPDAAVALVRAAAFVVPIARPSLPRG